MSTQKRPKNSQRLHEEQLQPRRPPGQPGRDGLDAGARAEPAADGAVELRQRGAGLRRSRATHGLLVSSLDDIAAQAQRAAEIVRRVRGFVRPAHPGRRAGRAERVRGQCAGAAASPRCRQRKARVDHALAGRPARRARRPRAARAGAAQSGAEWPAGDAGHAGAAPRRRDRHGGGRGHGDRCRWPIMGRASSPRPRRSCSPASSRPSRTVSGSA